MAARLFSICFCFLLTTTALGQVGSKGCNKLERTEDRFDGKIRIVTPYKLMNLYRVHKVIEGDETRIYLDIRGGGYTASVGEKGVIVLLEDGTKLEWPDAGVDCDVATGGGGFQYTAFIRLTDEDIDKLSASKISGAKLYIYEVPAYKKNVAELMQQMGCIRDVN